MAESQWDQLFEQDRDYLRSQHLNRSQRVIKPIDAAHVELDGRRLVNFSSNNYLGLSHHLRVIAAVADAARAYGAGSGAAALISGHTELHHATEQAIARWKGTERAVLLPSGYQANHAAIQTIAAVAHARERPARILLDKLCHASLIDAVRGSGLTMRVFPHNDLDKLRRLLTESDVNELQVVVTESTFSMDGDRGALAGIVALKAFRPFLLVVDEAHGGGVYGAGGSGLVAELGLSERVDVSIATFSKAAGVAGGAVCASSMFINALLSRGRAFMYSTSVPPAVAAGVQAAIAVMRDEPQHQARVRALAIHVRNELAGVGLQLPDGDSPILPIILGDEQAALKVAGDLLQAGMLVVAVRPPTVARGTSRLRVTLSAAHTDAEIDQLLDALKQLKLSA